MRHVFSIWVAHVQHVHNFVHFITITLIFAVSIKGGGPYTLIALEPCARCLFLTPLDGLGYLIVRQCFHLSPLIMCSAGGTYCGGEDGAGVTFSMCLSREREHRNEASIFLHCSSHFRSRVITADGFLLVEQSADCDVG